MLGGFQFRLLGLRAYLVLRLFGVEVLRCRRWGFEVVMCLSNEISSLSVDNLGFEVAGR